VPDKNTSCNNDFACLFLKAFQTRHCIFVVVLFVSADGCAASSALIMFRYSAVAPKGLSDELVVERAYCCGRVGLLQIHPAENGLPSPWLIRTIRTSQLRHSFTIVSTNTIRATNANQAFTDGKK
jgi:hypothetical protein